MSTRPTHAGEPVETGLDPRWQLVERIVNSQSFAKCARLSSFLTCVCDLARRGEVERINEQYIGTNVFGRRQNYDPAADSIVRSHASRLRHRLNQYFVEEGAGEQWLLTIPKGSYLPVFHKRRETAEAFADGDAIQDAEIKPSRQRQWTLQPRGSGMHPSRLLSHLSITSRKAGIWFRCSAVRWPSSHS